VFLEKKDPLRKAERAQKKSSRPESALAEKPAESGQPSRIIRQNEAARIAVAASVKHELYRRTQGQCTKKNPDGTRCTQTKWLHAHHIKPLSEEGTNAIENLTLLCSGHHRMIHHRKT